MSVLPWPNLLSQAIRLGMGPSVFWELSIAEWRALMDPDQGQNHAMNHAVLDQLSRRFPDEEIPPHDINE